MFKKTAALTTLMLALIGSLASAQTTTPQPPATNDPTNAVIGYWGMTHVACVSSYGSHSPRYSVQMELNHTRTEFILNSRIGNESCRIEGNYKTENNMISYETKAQECATAKLSDELKSQITNGYMLVNLGSEIADKVCPVRGSTIRLYLIRR